MILPEVMTGNSWKGFIDAAQRSYPEGAGFQGNPPLNCDDYVIGGTLVVSDPGKPLGLATKIRVTLKPEPDATVPMTCLIDAAAEAHVNGLDGDQLWQQPDFKGPYGHFHELNKPANWTIEPIGGDVTPNAEFIRESDGSYAVHVHASPGQAFVSLKADIGDHTHDALGTPIAVTPSYQTSPGSETWRDFLGEYAMEGVLGIGLLCAITAGAWRHISIQRHRTRRNAERVRKSTARAQIEMIKEGILDLDVMNDPGVLPETKGELRRAKYVEKIEDGKSRWEPPKKKEQDVSSNRQRLFIPPRRAKSSAFEDENLIKLEESWIRREEQDALIKQVNDMVAEHMEEEATEVIMKKADDLEDALARTRAERTPVDITRMKLRKENLRRFWK